MDNVTMEGLRQFVVVALAILAAIVALDKGIDAIRHLRGDKQKAEKEENFTREIAQLKNRVTLCEERLARGDAQFMNLSADNKQMLMVLNGMLMHFISGNDHDKLKSVKAELDNYMAERR